MSEKLTTGSDVGKLLSDETRSVLNTSNVGLSTVDEVQKLYFQNKDEKVNQKLSTSIEQIDDNEVQTATEQVTMEYKQTLTIAKIQKSMLIHQCYKLVLLKMMKIN